MRTITLSVLLPLFFTAATLGQNKGVPSRFIVFMAPDCPISQFYTPLLRTYSEQTSFQQKSFTLAFTTGDSASVAQFEQKYRTGWPLLWGPEAQLLAKQHQASVTPELVVLNSNQKILYRGRLNDAYAAPGRKKPKIKLSEIDTLYQAYLKKQSTSIAHQPAIGCLMNP